MDQYRKGVERQQNNRETEEEVVKHLFFFLFARKQPAEKATMITISLL